MVSMSFLATLVQVQRECVSVNQPATRQHCGGVASVHHLKKKKKKDYEDYVFTVCKLHWLKQESQTSHVFVSITYFFLVII